MIAETDLTARLDALGRALSTNVPLEPPAEFMHAVQHQHRVSVVKRGGAAVAGVAVILALAYLAKNFNSAPPHGSGTVGRGSVPANNSRSHAGEPDDVIQK